MKERLKKLRKALDLTQQEFADRIGISRGNIATYETRDGSPGNSVVNLICREFNVSETWLRTGEGEMFVDVPSDTLDAMAREYHLDRFGRTVVEKMLNLNEKQWAAFHDFAMDVLESLSEAPAAPVFETERPAAETPDLAAEIENLKRQNRELAAEIEAIKEEDASIYKVSPLESAGTFSQRTKASK